MVKKWARARWLLLALAGLSPCALAAPQIQGQIDAALGTGNAGQAEKLADTALAGTAVSPADHSALLVDRGMAREAQGRHDEALVDLTQAIDMRVLPAPDQAHALFTRGAILDGLGRMIDALGDYSAALALQPHFAAALNNRANIYRRQNHFSEAERDYLASLSAGNLQPEYSYYGLGQIAEAKGNSDGARGFYGQAIAANPNYALAVERLAVLGGGPGMADTGTIHLHPPKSAPAAETAPVVLKPPASTMLQPSSRMVPANYQGEGAGLGLRPALDATGRGAPGNRDQVQLGAWRSEEEAGQGWNIALRQSGGLLNGMSPQILVVDLPGKGRYYRLRVGPAAGGPAKFCAALQAQGVDCMPVRD